MTYFHDDYRAAAAERLRQRVANHEPHVNPEWSRAFEQGKLQARATIEAWDAIRGDLPDTPVLAELRRKADATSKQEWVDATLDARAQARAAALAEAEREPRGSNDGSRVPDLTDDPHGQRLEHDRLLYANANSQVARHAAMAAAGNDASDGGAGQFAADIAARERAAKEKP